MKGNMHKENSKIEKDRSYEGDELIIVKKGKGYLTDEDLKELGITREELDSYQEDDDETDASPISLAERMGSENVAPGLVYETPRKQENDVPELRGDFIEDLTDEDEEILDKVWAEIRKEMESDGRL